MAIDAVLVIDDRGACLLTSGRGYMAASTNAAITPGQQGFAATQPEVGLRQLKRAVRLFSRSRCPSSKTTPNTRHG